MELGLVTGTLQRTTAAFTALVRTVDDPAREAIGGWTIGETAAHVATVAVLSSASVAGMPPPGHLRPFLDRAASVGTFGEVAEMNALALACEPERDPVLLAHRIQRQVDELVTAAAPVDGNEVRWLGGLRLSAAGVLGHLVSEMLIHGHDIATAEGRRFDLPSPAAGLVFETFFLDLLESPEVSASRARRAASVGRLSCELRLRGSQPVTVAAEDGTLVVTRGPAPHPVDVRISADPGTLLRLLFNRITPLSAVRRGRLLVWGRRPWKVRRLADLVTLP